MTPSLPQSPARAATPARFYRAPGKMFWLGEYAVLEGGEALVASVDRYAYASWHPDPDARGLTVRSSHDEEPLQIVPNAWRAGAAEPPWALVDAVIATLHDQLPHFAIPRGVLRLDSETLHADTKLGLGSSGVIAALTTAALSDAQDAGDARDGRAEGGGRSALTELSLAAHDRFQGGEGSGGDVIASIWGGLNSVQRRQRRPVELPADLYHCALYTGRAANTRALVRAVRQAARHRPAVRDILARLGRCAQLGIHALRSADIAEWMGAIREFHALETALTESSGAPIVSEDVARCVALAEQAGCAAKASGAGGGDVVVAFTPNGSAIRALRGLCEAADIDMLGIGIDSDGLRETPPKSSDSALEPGPP